MLGELQGVVVKRGTIEDEVRQGALQPLRANTSEVFSAARELLMLIEEMIGLTGEIEECGDAWPFELRRKCGHPSFSSERAALESLFGDLDVLVKARADFLKSLVVFPAWGLA